MNIAHHFLALRSAVPIEKDARSTITLEEIADICSCTVRNAKLLIKQMTEHGWIRWFPGRGRGNRSSVQFLKNVDDIAVVLAEAHIDKGNLQKAFALLDSFEVRGTLRDSFIEGVYQRLGYQMETIDDGQLEILRFPFYRPIPRLDPMFVTRRTEAHMVKQLFDTLVCYDAAAKVVKPHLAHFWESSGDGTVWTFNLRKGVLFHHKRELTAHDVAFTLDRLRTLAAEDPFYRLFVAFKKVEVVSNTMIRIHIGEPNFLFLHFLTATAASIVPRDAVFSESVEFTRMPIGSGPFRLRRNDESLFCMEAFAPYFQGRPHLDRVELWIMPEVND
ncbi:MAG: ABC transporter substrate-binding protein, partial [Clostridia bacterium]